MVSKILPRIQHALQTTFSGAVMVVQYSSSFSPVSNNDRSSRSNVSDHLPELVLILDDPNLLTLSNREAGRVGAAGLGLRRRGLQPA